MIRRIAGLGAGTMGHGIAHAPAAAGYETVLFDVSPDAVERGRRAIEEIVRDGVERGKIAAGDASTILGRLGTANDLGKRRSPTGPRTHHDGREDHEDHEEYSRAFASIVSFAVIVMDGVDVRSSTNAMASGDTC